jgi:TctA family transporter
MFDLNEKISMWRSNLAQSETLAGSDIEELESHLREEIEQLTGLKLSDEEAFLIAAHRLGSTDSLAAEYEKINSSLKFRRRFSLMIAGILAYLLATYFATSASRGWVWLAATNGIRDYTLASIGFISQILTLVATFFFGYFICKIILHRPGFRKQINKLRTRLLLLLSLLVILIIITLSRIFFPVMVFRIVKPQEYGQVVHSLTYSELLWSVLFPFLLVVLLIKLRKPDLHKVDVS